MHQHPALHQHPAFHFTRHAETRLQQRGFAKRSIELALWVHDTEVPVGKGCQAWSVSRRGLEKLRAAGLPGRVVDRLAKAILIVEPWSGTVLTVVKGHCKAARRLRRVEPSRKRWRRGNPVADAAGRRDKLEGVAA